MNAQPGTMSRWGRASATYVLTLAACSAMAVPCSSDEQVAEQPGGLYQLQEQWSVSAQGPVHLREKRVTAEYWIRVARMDEDADGERVIQLRFERVVAEVDVPAQRRKGQFDSRLAAEPFTIEHHELVRPAALAGQTLRLRFSARMTLEGISGLEDVANRAEDLYNRCLRGSEQELHTRDFVCQSFVVERFRRSWADLFRIGPDDRQEVGTDMPRSEEAFLVACIPSESWMRQVGLPVRETVSTVRLGDGRTEIVRQASLSAPDRVRTTIGEAGWTYEPSRLTRELTMLVRDDGHVDAARRHQTVVLETTLSLERDIPIRMTIHDSVELKRQRQ